MTKLSTYLLVTIVYLTYTVFDITAFREQSIAIKGKLLCGQRPLKNVTVQLLEKRKSPFRDQVLASNTTDNAGLFILAGGTSRILQITPLLVVQKNCNGKEESIKLSNAKTAVAKSKLPEETYDVGIINMDAWNKPQ